MKPVLSKFRTFREAEEATLAYDQSPSSKERVEILFSFPHKEDDATSGRLARVDRIAELKRG